MILFGTYPFLLHVANTFNPDSEATLNVTCHRFRSYYDDEKIIIETCKKCKLKVLGGSGGKEGRLVGFCNQTKHLMEYSIKPGDRIVFPLYFGDEYLEISFDPKEGNLSTSTYPYTIFTGKKAKAIFTFDDLTVVPTYPKDDKILEDGFYPGGGWVVKEKNKDSIWKLIIKKYGTDPETDDVVIGPPPPA